MSGITGFLDPSLSLDASSLTASVTRMAGALTHRGPDVGREWVDEGAGAALGYRQHSITLLPPAAAQPLGSPDGRYIFIFDGQVYNRSELCQHLGSALSPAEPGLADPPLILECITRWGLLPALQRFNGMFAIALWDRQDQRLFLARDRMGVKPLYYGWCGRVFMFGSQLIALQQHSSFDAAVDPDALSLLLRYGYIPSPHAIFRGIRKLLPGTLLEVNPFDPPFSPVPQPYWSARQVAVSGVAHPLRGSDDDAVGQLHTLLQDSIISRMAAGVPVGAFLSGGVDSSTIAALMQAQSSQPVSTFAIGFQDSAFNEANHARAVADHLHTDHHEWLISSADALAVIPHLPEIYDEPFADSSQIPTFLVSTLARRHVAVSLSGDGGDEPFAGYTRYPGCSKLWRSMRRVPYPIRLLAQSALDGLSASGINPNFLPPALQKATRDRRLLAARTPQQLYLSFISLWDTPPSALVSGQEPLTSFSNPALWPPELDFDHWMMYVDHFTLNPEDVLVKTDRAGTAASLEIRAPLLDDHRLVEFAWKVPLALKLRSGRGKWLLRQVLYRYVPPRLIDRPKQGFKVPLAEWLRGPLRDWAETQLSESRLSREGWFSPQVVRKRWSGLLNNRGASPGDLWAVLMFQAWLEHLGR